MNTYDDIPDNPDIPDTPLTPEDFYNKYQGVLHKIAVVLHIPVSETDDIVQETFISYFDHYSINWTPVLQKATLVQILRHKAIDYHRKYGRYEALSLDDEDNVIAETEFVPQGPSNNPIDIMMQNDAYEHIVDEIKNLKPEWRELAILYFLDQRTITEICETLNISKTVCCTRIYRIKNRLKEILGPEYNI